VSERKVVFTAGTGRGGTTLLNLILGSHSRGFAIGEIFGLPGRLRESDGAPCRFCGRHCHLWTQPFMDELIRRYWPARGLRGRLSRLGRRHPGLYTELFGRIDADALFDASKSLPWLHSRLADRRDWRSASPYLVLVTRDGRAVINSFRRKDPEVPTAEYTSRWMTRMTELERLYADFDPQHRVRIAYERLAASPLATVKHICRVLDLSFEPAMVNYWLHEHHTLGGNKGTHYIAHQHRHSSTSDDIHRPATQQQSYYDDHGQSIKLDERWREEMPVKDLEVFENLAGKINASYAHGD